MTEPDIRFGNLPPDVPQTAHAHLSAVLPWLRVAIAAAKEKVPGGQIGLGILITRPDGSGEITAAMDCENFADYLEDVLDDLAEARVRQVWRDGKVGPMVTAKQAILAVTEAPRSPMPKALTTLEECHRCRGTGETWVNDGDGKLDPVACATCHGRGTIEVERNWSDYIDESGPG